MPESRRVIISVVSDLVTDQRVHRTALALHTKGLKVMLVGRRKRASLNMPDRPYSTKRFRLLFENGPLFYAAFNIRLFFYLLFNKADILVANDLDTLIPNYLTSKLKNAELFYDSHEYFTEVPELVSRPSVQKVWRKIEGFIFPKLKYAFTVNRSIADIYSEKYKVDVGVIRNLPLRNDQVNPAVTRSEMSLPENKKIFLFQGAGINIDRGAEEAVEAIALVDNAVLLFIGGGDVIDIVKQKATGLNLSDKVYFIPKQPMEKLRQYTALADFGLSLDKNSNLNYRYSLPNKLFDYIHAGLPVLVSDLPEVRNIVDNYKIGLVTSSHSPNEIASTMKAMMSDENRIGQWKSNLQVAAKELSWEQEEKKLFEIFKDVI